MLLEHKSSSACGVWRHACTRCFVWCLPATVHSVVLGVLPLTPPALLSSCCCCRPHTPVGPFPLAEMPDALRDSLASPSSPYALDSPRGSKLTRTELAFVTACMASSSSSRPDVRELLDSQAYLSSRYRGG